MSDVFPESIPEGHGTIIYTPMVVAYFDDEESARKAFLVAGVLGLEPTTSHPPVEFLRPLYNIGVQRFPEMQHILSLTD